MEKSLSSRDLLMEKSPLLALMLLDTEPKEIIKESLPLFNLGKADLFYFYGLGDGSIFFQCQKWLKESSEKQLVILEDDLGLIASFLETDNAKEILSHPQVNLEYLAPNIEEVVQNYATKRVEVAGLLSKGNLEKLRLSLLRKTALFFALQTDRLHGNQPFQNFIANLKHMPSSFYANGFKGAFQNVPAIVCGAGPSLESTMDLLKTQENKALIIAGGSAIAALSSSGVIPHFGMAIDPNLEEYRRLKNSFAFEMPFLYSTRVHPGVFQTCNGPFGYMRSGIGGAPELWIEEELGLTDPLLGENISEEAISVTAICIAWAEFLGCNPILINGVDMAYTGNKHYAAGVVETESLAFDEIDREKSAADRIIPMKAHNGQDVCSAIRWVMESSSISYFAEKYPHTTFINTTEGGIGFEKIDYVPLAQSVQGFKEKDIRKKIAECIQQNPMPRNSSLVIFEKVKELLVSLDRLIAHLEVLADMKKGSKALAEVELKEELATSILFYDIFRVFKEGPHFWRNWLKLARDYKKAWLY